MSSLSVPLISSAAQPALPLRRGYERFFYSLTLIVSMVLWLPQAIRWMQDGDFVAHSWDVDRTLVSLEWVILNVPHFMFQALSAGVSRLLGLNVFYSMALVITLAVLATNAILFVLYRRALAGTQPLTLSQGWLIVAAVVITGLVAPLNLLTPDNYYFGYFAPTVYHNPTVTLMRPSAIVLFLAGLTCFNAAWRPKPLALVGWTVAYGLLTVFCLFSKPNFIIAWLPPLALVTLYFMVRRQTIHWIPLIAGIVLPAGMMLLIQTQTWSTSAGIEFSPFELYDLWKLHYDPTANQFLVWKHIASVAFPALVYLLFAREAVRSLTFNLAWLTFIFGVAYTDLLIDRSNPTAGDFTWGAQFGAYLLFIVALLFLLRRWDTANKHKARWLVCSGVLGLHLVCGLVWYGLHFTQPYYLIIQRWW